LSFLLDTNVVSELRKGDRAHPNVRLWYTGVVGTELYLSTLVLGEIRKGIEMARRRDAGKAQALEQWLDRVTQVFAAQTLGVSSEVADEWGRMNAVRSIPAIDGLLAATAKVHGLTLATRNVAHVANLVEVVDPFSDRITSPA
jgi:hypothetical protein